jgi:hypothetical protein
MQHLVGYLEAVSKSAAIERAVVLFSLTDALAQAPGVNLRG